jgi:hypothetical protein
MDDRQTAVSWQCADADWQLVAEPSHGAANKPFDVPVALVELG